MKKEHTSLAFREDDIIPPVSGVAKLKLLAKGETLRRAFPFSACFKNITVVLLTFIVSTVLAYVPRIVLALNNSVGKANVNQYKIAWVVLN